MGPDSTSQQTALRLELLGGFRLRHQRATAPHEIPIQGKKNRALLAVLALAPSGSTSRQSLADLLWSDRPEQQGRNSLRQALVTLKANLAAVPVPPLVLEDDLVRLDFAQISIDAVDLLRSAEVADWAKVAGLFKGPLLSGFTVNDNAFEEWLRGQNDQVQSRVVQALEHLAAAGDIDARRSFAQRLLALDPLREASHRSLMAAHAAAGEKALALKQYEACRDMLKAEMGIAPSRQTEDLYRQIRDASATSTSGSIGADRATPLAAEMPRSAHAKPSIGILPFANLSGDEDQKYLSDGICSDITVELSRFHTLTVIAANGPNAPAAAPAIATGAASLQLAEIGARLGVEYLLSGSVRNTAQQLRISVQLIAVDSGAIVWARHFDAKMSDMFSVQDEMVSVIASALTGQMQSDIATRLGQRHPQSVAAYDLALRGLQHQQMVTRRDTDLSIDYLERAIALDPGYAEAHAWLAISYHTIWHADFIDGLLNKAIDAAEKSVELAPYSSSCHQALGYCLLPSHQHERVAHHLDTAFALNPNDPLLMMARGLHATYRGRLAEAEQHFAEGARLSLYPPAWFGEFRSFAAFVGGDFETARAGLELAQRSFSDMYWDSMYLLSCYGHLGLAAEAATLIERCQRSHPLLSFPDIAAQEPFQHAAGRDRLLRGLEIALAAMSVD